MNEIYGVDPDAPKDLQELRSMFERFGPASGRFIGRYPDDWLSLLESRFTNLSGLDRSRMSLLLQRHRDTLLGVEGQYFRSRSWSENARLVRQFKKVLGSSPNPHGLPTLDDFLWDDSEVDSSRGTFIPMTVSAYCTACAPLFEISSEVHITDRFLRLRHDSGHLDRRRLDLIRSMAHQAERSGRCSTLFLHFELPNFSPEAAYDDQLKRDLGSIQADTRVQIYFDIHSRLQHGRYVFSVKGGLQFDHGLQLDATGSNHIHWLSVGELRPIQRVFGLAV